MASAFPITRCVALLQFALLLLVCRPAKVRAQSESVLQQVGTQLQLDRELNYTPPAKRETTDEDDGAVSFSTRTEEESGDKGHPSLSLANWVPLVLVAASMALLLDVVAFGTISDPQELALACGVFANFQDNMIFTSALIGSREFFEELGLSSTDSGVMLGGHKVGVSCAFLTFMALLKFYPEIWQHSRPVMQVGVAFQLVGGLAFCMLGYHGAEWGASKEIMMRLLCASRFMTGYGGGCQVALAFFQTANCLTGFSRSVHNMRMFMSGCLGLGAGPLLSSALTEVGRTVPAWHALSPIQVMMQVPIVMASVQALLLCRIQLPALDSGYTDISKPITENASLTTFARVASIFVCLGMQVLRGLSLASLEAGIPDALESCYYWSASAAGIATAAVVVSVIPVQLLFEKFKGRLSSASWTTLMLSSSVAVCCGMLLELDFAFLSSATVVFPLMALSSGLIMGMVQDLAFPDGVLSLSVCTLLMVCTADLLGRGQGPALARWSVEQGGQKGLAIVQLCSCVGSVLLYAVIIGTSALCGRSQCSAHPMNDPEQGS